MPTKFGLKYVLFPQFCFQLMITLKKLLAMNLEEVLQFASSNQLHPFLQKMIVKSSYAGLSSVYNAINLDL